MSRIKPDQETLYQYAQKKLTDAEEEQVELWLMENPSGLEDAILDQHLSLGIVKEKTRERFRFRNSFHWVAYPAILALAVVSFLLPDQLAGLRPRADVQVVRLSEVRGAAPKDVPMVFTNAPLLIEVPLPLYAAGPFSVGLSNKTGRKVDLGDQVPNAAGVMSVLIPQGYLSDGFWDITLSTGDKVTGRWSISVSGGVPE